MEYSDILELQARHEKQKLEHELLAIKAQNEQDTLNAGVGISTNMVSFNMAGLLYSALKED